MDALNLVMLLPPGSPDLGDESPPTGPTATLAHASPTIISERNPNLDKLLWEQWGVARQARQRQADLLHTPYLTAPLPIADLTKYGRQIKEGATKQIRNPQSAIRNRQIVTAHDMIPWVVPGYAGSRFFKLYLALAAAGVKRAAAIMADSEASRRDVIRILRVPPRKVHTVYLGMEPPPPYTEAELYDMRARYGLPRRYAFYLGGFDRRKNVPLLLRAWSSALPRLDAAADEKPLLVVGGGVPEPGGVFPDVPGEAASLGFAGPDSPVRFIGRVSESDKPLLMAAAHLFVYPSAYEGFGLDPLEAMSVGCPVVSSSGGSLAEVVGDGGLLVLPDNERALSEAIMRAWHDSDLRAHLTQKGKTQAAQFTWERTARQTLQVYSHVHNRNLSRNGRRAK